MQGIQSCDVRVGSNTNCCEMTVNSPEAKTVNFSLGVFIYSSNNTYTCRYRRNVSPPGFSAFICSLYWARIRSIQSYQRESRSPEFILTARFIALLLDCETHVCVYNSIWGIWHPSAALLSNRDESSESSAVLNWTSWLQPRLFWMTSQREGVLIDSCSSALRWLCVCQGEDEGGRAGFSNAAEAKLLQNLNWDVLTSCQSVLQSLHYS